jgi:hypothetical protein
MDPLFLGAGPSVALLEFEIQGRPRGRPFFFGDGNCQLQGWTSLARSFINSDPLHQPLFGQMDMSDF